MPLSNEAIEHDSKWSRYKISEVYDDPDFNSRGNIIASDIVELMKDIEAKGLLQPVTLRALWDTEEHLKLRGFKYSLISGFRRFSAYRALGAVEIPGHLRDVKTDFEAKDINAVENLQRQDLTFWQECQSIRHYWLGGWSRQEIAHRINKSDGWVQVRIMLLEMEPEIQIAAHQGFLKPSDVRTLHAFHGNDRLRRAGIMRDARKKGDKSIAVKLKKKDKASTRRTRTKSEICDMADYIREFAKKIDPKKTITAELIVSSQGTLFPMHRFTAWCVGDIRTDELHTSLRDFFFGLDVMYETPEMEPENVI